LARYAAGVPIAETDLLAAWLAGEATPLPFDIRGAARRLWWTRPHRRDAR